MELVYWRVDHDVDGEQWETRHARQPPIMPRMPGQPERVVVEVRTNYELGDRCQVRQRGKWRPGQVIGFIHAPVPMAHVEYWRNADADLAMGPFAGVDIEPPPDPRVIVQA